MDGAGLQVPPLAKKLFASNGCCGRAGSLQGDHGCARAGSLQGVTTEKRATSAPEAGSTCMYMWAALSELSGGKKDPMGRKVLRG